MKPTAEKGLQKSQRMIVADYANERSLPVKKAFTTNILEDDGDEIGVLMSQKGGKKVANIEVTVRPFEVVTLRLEF